MEVERKILGENLAMENILEEFAVAGTHPDGVVRHLGISPWRSEVEHEEAHGIMGGGEFQAG